MRLFVSRYTGERYRVFTRLGLKNILWAISTTETLVGKLRSLWHVFYDGELCMRCGRRYTLVWWCESNDLWHKLTGRGAGGTYCPRCFDAKAQQHGLLFFWTPRLQNEVRFERGWPARSEFSRRDLDAEA